MRHEGAARADAHGKCIDGAGSSAILKVVNGKYVNVAK